MPAAYRPPRVRRLQTTVLVASWWIAFQGFLYLILNDHTAVWFGVRYNGSVSWIFSSTGLAFLCLALFINRSIREGQRQYLAIDTLVIFFLGRVIAAFNQIIRETGITWFDELGLLMDLSLAGCLIYFRTRGSEMGGPKTVIGYDAVEAFKDLKTWYRTRKLPKERLPRSLGDLHADLVEPKKAEESAQEASEKAPETKRSVAMPHMD